jgi:16S rRNA (cytosine967-C5)-methyltransferase
MPNARNIAATVLINIHADEGNLDQLLNQAEKQIQRLNRSDRALVHVIVYGVLRWQKRLDWVIDHLTTRPGKKIDPLVRVIVRMGLFQMHYLDRIPVSAAVNTCVELTKKNRRKWASGFVNGILRRAVDRGKNIPWPDRHSDPAAYLSVYHSFPQWLVARWIDFWGMDETEALCEAMNTIPKITIRTNTLRVSRQDLLERIQTEAKEVRATYHSPEGISFSSLSRPMTRWDAFEKGWFQVQSEAAQCIVHLLSLRPGHKIWDACAGLGTKTAHAAQLMENQGHILATDISGNKLKQLKVEMDRLGLSIVQTLQVDLTHPPTDWHPGKYDRILVDAPCTGLGVLQKNPDGKWRSTPESIHKNSHRQLNLLNNCARHVKLNGLMVYAVCSMEPEENEKFIEGFLQIHSEFAIEHLRHHRIQKKDVFLTPDGYFKTIPHHHQMDGFFATILKRIE